MKESMFLTCLIALTPSSVQTAFDILQYDSLELGSRFWKQNLFWTLCRSQETQYFTVFSCTPHYQSSLIKCDMIWTQQFSHGLYFILEGIVPWLFVSPFQFAFPWHFQMYSSASDGINDSALGKNTRTWTLSNTTKLCCHYTQCIWRNKQYRLHTGPCEAERTTN